MNSLLWLHLLRCTQTKNYFFPQPCSAPNNSPSPWTSQQGHVCLAPFSRHVCSGLRVSDSFFLFTSRSELIALHFQVCGWHRVLAWLYKQGPKKTAVPPVSQETHLSALPSGAECHYIKHTSNCIDLRIFVCSVMFYGSLSVWAFNPQHNRTEGGMSPMKTKEDLSPLSLH